MITVEYAKNPHTTTKLYVTIATMKIKPLGDRVLVLEEQQEKEETTSAGIILPDSAKDTKSANRGEVVETNSKAVKKGDTVLFTYGDKLKQDNRIYRLVDATNIIAVIE